MRARHPSSGLPADYIEDELLTVLGQEELPLGEAAGLLVLLRALLRARRVAWRVATVSPTRSVRGLAGVYLHESNSRLTQLRAQFLLKTINEGVRAVALLIDAWRPDAVRSHPPDSGEIGRVWAEVARELGGEDASRCLRDAVDADDVFARIAEFYFGRPQASAAVTLGKMIRDFYHPTARKRVDVVAPEKLKPERPLRDTVHDLRAFVASIARPQVSVLDYGAGLGRTRHYFYASAMSEDCAPPVEALSEVNYVSVETADSLKLLRSRRTYPNGPHPTERFGYACRCRECSAGDALLVINPLRTGTVTLSTSLEHEGAEEGRFLPHRDEWSAFADVGVLVNVLHEIPFASLHVLLHNLRTALKPNGILLIYEMLGLTTVEDSYVIWYPEDIRKAFSLFGFRVVVVPGRTRNPHKGSWGHPYCLAVLQRSDDAGVSDPSGALREFWKGRSERLSATIQSIEKRLKGGCGTDADRLEHFHAVQSLVNALLQSTKSDEAEG